MGLNLEKLQKRSISAVVLGVPALGMIWYGGIFFSIVVVVFLGLALREWVRLAHHLTAYKHLFFLAGIFYLLLTASSFYALGAFEFDHAAFVLILLVSSSDIGAYFAGKLIGGAKMAQAISPNKTWAGLAGALAGCTLAGVLCWAGGLYIPSLLFAFIAGPLIGLSGQIGDLLVSYMKRRAGVKDTGGIIPGHGGILDRIDSLLLSAPVFLLISVLFAHV